MLDGKLYDLINNQVNKEIYSAYLYLDIANYYAEHDLNGFSSWFYLQATEEMEHAEKFIHYLHENDHKVNLETIDKPTNEFNGYREPLEFQLRHEKIVTELIENIYKVSLECNDYKTTLFLNWFIEEQGEEERHAQDLINKYDFLVSSNSNIGLHHMDNELKQRK